MDPLAFAMATVALIVVMGLVISTKIVRSNQPASRTSDSDWRSKNVIRAQLGEVEPDILATTLRLNAQVPRDVSTLDWHLKGADRLAGSEFDYDLFEATCKLNAEFPSTEAVQATSARRARSLRKQ